MRRLDNKGFTLIEVLAVVVIIGIIGLISVPSVISIINTGKDSSYDILVKDITVAAIQLHEEVSFAGTSIYHYKVFDEHNDNMNTDKNVKKGKDINDNIIGENSIKINLQTLVSNGFLTGTNNPDKINNKNGKIITNPKTGNDMGTCEIKIIKEVDKDNNYNTTYKIEKVANDIDDDDEFEKKNCPTSDEYNKALNN